MKKGFITTVAGTATRFNKDTKIPAPKCLYSSGDYTQSIISKLLSYHGEFDKIFVVGGYMFDVLEDYLKQYHSDKNIELIYNPHYIDLGSLESLKLGIDVAKAAGIEHLVFAEGDLLFDNKTFESVIKANDDVITTNSEPITADKTVALYTTADNQIKYAFDTAHKSLSINEPFTAIYNSAQVWSFSDTKRLYALNDALTLKERGGTNLQLVEKYYADKVKNPRIVRFEKWFNCNTVSDYNTALNELKGGK